MTFIRKYYFEIFMYICAFFLILYLFNLVVYNCDYVDEKDCYDYYLKTGYKLKTCDRWFK